MRSPKGKYIERSVHTINEAEGRLTMVLVKDNLVNIYIPSYYAIQKGS